MEVEDERDISPPEPWPEDITVEDLWAAIYPFADCSEKFKYTSSYVCDNFVIITYRVSRDHLATLENMMFKKLALYIILGSSKDVAHCNYIYLRYKIHSATRLNRDTVDVSFIFISINTDNMEDTIDYILE